MSTVAGREDLIGAGAIACCGAGVEVFRLFHPLGIAMCVALCRKCDTAWVQVEDFSYEPVAPDPELVEEARKL